MPEAGLAAVDALLAIVHEREHLRSAAIDLMRAGLPSNVAADIREFARIRRRECFAMECCAGLRYTLGACIYSIRVAVTIFVDALTVVMFEFRPHSCAIACGDWRDEHVSSLKDMPRAFRDAAMAMLAIGEHFANGWPNACRVFREATEFIRDARDPLPEWWTAVNGSCGGTILARVCDAEIIIPGSFCCSPCEVKWRRCVRGLPADYEGE